MPVSRLIRIARLRWRTASRPAALDHELDRELAFHFDQLVHEHVAAGLPPAAAARAARRELGNVDAAKDYARDHRRLSWLHDLRHDLSHAVNRLRAKPGGAMVAIVSLALALGLNAAVLSAIRTTFLKPLPFPHANRLVIMRTQSQVDGVLREQSSQLEFLAWRNHTSSFDVVEASISGERDLSADGDRPAAEVVTRAVTPGWLAALGVRAEHGRVFDETDYRPLDGPDVVLISHQLWVGRYQGDSSILARPIRVNGRDARIVGILPAGFSFEDRRVHAWLPLRLDPARTEGTLRWFNVVARLKPGVELESAQADVTRASRDIAARLPPKLDWRPQVAFLNDTQRSWAARPLWSLLGTTALVLIIVCANLAGLRLAQQAARRHEFSTRAALGATRGRLVRQVVGETFFLIGAAAMLGLVVAETTLWALAGIMSPPIGSARFMPGGVDAWLVAAMVVLAAVAGVFIALAPALLTPRRRSAFVVVQIAASVVLLVSAALVVRSVVQLTARDLGFDRQRLLTFRMRAESDDPFTLFRKVREEIAGIPGVDAAAGVSDWSLTSIVLPKATVRVEGKSRPAPVTPTHLLITTGFFQSMRTPVIDGREFTDADDPAAEWGLVVNRAAAALFWPGENPIGREITITGTAGERPRCVIGVVADVPLHRQDLNPLPIIYSAYAQQPPYRRPLLGSGQAGRMVLVVRAQGEPERIAREAERRAAKIAPDRPLVYLGPAGQSDVPLREFRNYAAALSAIGLLAILLAVIGLYGVIAQAVIERAREIGVRLALGARRWDVIRVVGRDAAIMIGAGLILGFAGTLVLPTWIASRLWAVSPTAPDVLLGVNVLVTATVLAATWIPVRRALRVDPALTLRED